MDLSRQKFREDVKDMFKHAKTCMLSRNLCFIVRKNRAVLTKRDVQKMCLEIARLCEEAGCKEQSVLCHQACVLLVQEGEEKYLEVCMKSCKKCGHQRKTDKNKLIYVA